MRGQSRPARKPLERCLCLLTAVLLNKPARLLLQDDLRLSGAAYTVGSEQRAATWGRPYGRAGNLTLGRTLCIPTKNEKRSGGLPVQKRNPLHPWRESPLCGTLSYKYWKLWTTMPKCPIGAFTTIFLVITTG